jgi:hypothetical protein
MRVTSTALLGIWGQQPIEDMTTLRTDFEMHANWQGYVEEPAAKDFVAKKARTVAVRVQGIQWNVIECEERLGNRPEAVIGQTTINLDLQVWKSLENSLPKLYCVDLAEDYVTQKSESLRIFVSKKRYFAISPWTFA